MRNFNLSTISIIERGRARAESPKHSIVCFGVTVQTPPNRTHRRIAEFAIHGPGFRHPSRNDGGGVNDYVLGEALNPKRAVDPEGTKEHEEQQRGESDICRPAGHPEGEDPDDRISLKSFVL